MLNSIKGAASNSSKAVSNSAAVDEEMVLRLSDSQSLEGLPNSEGDEDSSGEMASASGSMNSALQNDRNQIDLQAAANAYYGGIQTVNKKNKNLGK